MVTEFFSAEGTACGRVEVCYSQKFVFDQDAAR